MGYAVNGKVIPCCQPLRHEITTPARVPSETVSEEVDQPTDVAVLRSLPGVGRVMAATLLAEAAQAIRDRDYESLRAYTGVAPARDRVARSRLS
jgi:transposase